MDKTRIEVYVEEALEGTNIKWIMVGKFDTSLECVLCGLGCPDFVVNGTIPIHAECVRQANGV